MCTCSALGEATRRTPCDDGGFVLGSSDHRGSSNVLWQPYFQMVPSNREYYIASIRKVGWPFDSKPQLVERTTSNAIQSNGSQPSVGQGAIGGL